MSDKIPGKRFSNAVGLGAIWLCTVASPVLAGEVVLYGDLPRWVEPYEIDDKLIAEGPSALLFDWQHRLDGGTVTSYEDSAIRIDNPDTLMEEGTVSLTWMPDKGDLTVHRVEILRGDEVIDVVAGGARFEVLRREQGLEDRLIDGELTATLAVPGLQVGDILHVVSSTTTRDQALGEAMQATQYLPPDPWQVGFARAIVSWPKDEQVFVHAEDAVALAQPETVGDSRRVVVSLPLAKPVAMPEDAPYRFRRPSVLRAGTFADWGQLSSAMSPHYEDAAKLSAGGDAAAQVAAIMRATDKPLERAARALRLVQDDVSYLLDGLDGGNYLPQTAEETWTKRYGDCKAKSVLLTAMLRQMGIEAVPVLVTTSGGDALPELLPLPANFDHMIVRARIEGADYWLDGTSTGTRLTNIADVPPYFHALPLTAEGSDLVAMTQREPAFPQMAMKITSDYSAGVDLPYLFEVDMKIYGAHGAPIRALVDANDPAQLRQMAASFASNSEGDGAVSSVTLDYDEDAAAASVVIRGVSDSDFAWDDGRLLVDTTVSGNQAFEVDRARPEWRDLPVQTPGPARTRVEVQMIFPERSEPFTLEGSTSLDARFANTSLAGGSRIEDGRMHARVEVVQRLGELAASDVPAAKRAFNRLSSNPTRVVAPQDVTWRWEVEPAELLRRAKPVLEGYTAAMAFAEPEDLGPLTARAAFRTAIYDWKGALADYDALVAKQPSSDIHLERAAVLFALDRADEGLADIQAAYNLQPDNGTAFYLAEKLAYAGREQEALALLESLPVGEDDRVYYADSLATVTALGGDPQAGLELIAEELADKPNNATALNSDCWFRGLFGVALDTAVDLCTKAVERADNAAHVLDSRAMVRYRLGQYDEALVDLDAALAVSPGLAASRYLRGIVRLEKGEAAGREDIEIALRMSPQIAEKYAHHGVQPGE